MKQRTQRSKQEVEAAVKNAFSYRQALMNLNIQAQGGNYKIIKRLVTEYEINTSHFKGQGWNFGLQITCNPPRPLEEILTENSNYQSHKLKLRLLKVGLKKRICEMCSLTTWLGEPIPLELDHINGINNDNRIENLRLLCPNCHAQTSTYRGKNKRN